MLLLRDMEASCRGPVRHQTPTSLHYNTILLMLQWDLQNIVGSEPLIGTWLESHEIKKNSVVTGIEPTTSALLDQRRSHSENQAPFQLGTYLSFYKLKSIPLP